MLLQVRQTSNFAKSRKTYSDNIDRLYITMATAIGKWLWKIKKRFFRSKKRFFFKIKVMLLETFVVPPEMAGGATRNCREEYSLK